MVSAGVVLLRVFLRRGIETPEQLEELGINVYASIPVAETFTKSVVQKKDGVKSLLKKFRASWRLITCGSGN
jgi:tyrosine-protein kinase Etk/Wzc